MSSDDVVTLTVPSLSATEFFVPLALGICTDIDTHVVRYMYMPSLCRAAN
jgi:hypothetical protein